MKFDWFIIFSNKNLFVSTYKKAASLVWLPAEKLAYL